MLRNWRRYPRILNVKKMPKKKLSLENILADHSPKLLGNGQIRMECPFRENHPDGSGRMSFFLSPELNSYHCFSCHAKGSLIKLLTTKFSVGYFEAVGMVRLSTYEKESKEFDLDIRWNTSIFPKEFIERGYLKDTLKHFKVGLTDEGEIVIPYYADFSTYGNLLGYQLRTYSPDRLVRNNSGFNKKEYLYNLDFSYDYTVLVEGQSDVWRLHEHGFNATGLMGSSLSSWQIENLSKFSTVYLALDNDETGRRATEVCNALLKNRTKVMLVPYSEKDPGETTKKSWLKAFSEVTDYVVYSMEMTLGWDGYLDMRDKVLKELR